MAIVLLAALLFRAYIPVGFMPASGTPFLVELCPAYPAGALMHHGQHHHSPNQGHFEDCPFGTAPALGPVAHAFAFEPAPPSAAYVAILIERTRFVSRRLRTQQPRGPPALA